eukprot:gene17752-biopygen13265
MGGGSNCCPRPPSPPPRAAPAARPAPPPRGRSLITYGDPGVGSARWTCSATAPSLGGSSAMLELLAAAQGPFALLFVEADALRALGLDAGVAAAAAAAGSGFGRQRGVRWVLGDSSMPRRRARPGACVRMSK